MLQQSVMAGVVCALLVVGVVPVQAAVLDLNEASVGELADVQGVGPVQAERIVLHRQTVGGFESIDELDSVWGLGPRTVQRLRPHVLVRPD
ncbi:ComEA family DNA-binding protein [Guyparkeria halophila]|uniref:ComEA family DNA-binding protein n=1 Tax=Guyparkeria halophila TaxID=47960 RepID=UPI0018CC1F75|nr:helix-hairpin-helix domain-containing protein [Guyparkeria halophila]